MFTLVCPASHRAINYDGAFLIWRQVLSFYLNIIIPDVLLNDYKNYTPDALPQHFYDVFLRFAQVMQMLCQILQTDDLSAVQSWLTTANDRGEIGLPTTPHSHVLLVGQRL